MKNNNIVYYHINKTTNDVFYVGIGRHKRAYAKINRNNHWHNVVNKHGYRIEIINKRLSWDDACEIEKELIDAFGRKCDGSGQLVNQTLGGEGNLGLRHTDDLKKKLSKLSSKPVVIDGVYYPSRNDAAKALGISRQSLYARLRTIKNKDKKPRTMKSYLDFLGLTRQTRNYKIMRELFL